MVEFYTKLAAYAKSKGVTVSIVSIKGEQCDLQTLSKLYQETGGSVKIVEPEELTLNFGQMVSKEAIAT